MRCARRQASNRGTAILDSPGFTPRKIGQNPSRFNVGLVVESVDYPGL